MNTIRISLNPNDIQKLQDFHNWVEKKSNELDLTDYWKSHTEKILISFEGDSVKLTGESGFYFPKPANGFNRLRHFMGQLPINISFYVYIFFRKIFNLHYEFLTTYPKAYDFIRTHDPLLRWHPSKNQINWKELKNTVLNFKNFKAMKKIWPNSHTHILDATSIKSYLYLQLLESKINKLTQAYVCEIGPGTGNLASLFYHHFKSKLFLVDLPKTLYFSFAHLSQSCPTARIALPHLVEAENFTPENYDIIMITPQQTSQIKDKVIDLIINTHSMQEMKDETISFYFNLIDRIIKTKGHFFCANSMEKVLDGKAIRFLEYPWRTNSKTIIFEKDPLLGLVNLSPSYIRLEQIP